MRDYSNYSSTPLEDKIMEEVLAGEKELSDDKRYSSLLHIDDVLSLPEIEESWLVKNIVLSQGITIISGLPNHFKSLFTQLLIKAVASGLSFLGQFVTQRGAVLVIDREIPTQRLKRRLKTLGGFNGLPIYFYPYSDPFKLDNREDAAYLRRIVKENDIKLVVIDTFNRSHSGKEINSSGDVGQIFEPLKAILEQTAIMLIHHSNKSGYTKEIPTPDELLGSVDFGAQTDLLFTLRKKDKNTVVVHNLKARDSELLNAFQLAFTDYHNGLIDLSYECEIKPEETSVVIREKKILEYLKSGKKKKSELVAYLEQLDYPEGTINNTLTVLKNKNLIESEQVGKEAHYFLLDTIRDSAQERFLTLSSIGNRKQGDVVEKVDTASWNVSQIDSCYVCGSKRFYKTADGTPICATCHPPISETNVNEGMEI